MQLDLHAGCPLGAPGRWGQAFFPTEQGLKQHTSAGDGSTEIPIDCPLCLVMLRTATAACRLKSIRQDYSIKANIKTYNFEVRDEFLQLLKAGEQQPGSIDCWPVHMPAQRLLLCIPSSWHCGTGPLWKPKFTFGLQLTHAISPENPIPMPNFNLYFQH